jgi:hypothetical protein
MPKLKLKSLYCETTEDSGGPDEAYLIVNGQQVWGTQSINDREGRPVDKEVDFTTSAEIKLYDEDTAVFDKDDHLGTVTAGSDLVGKGEQQGKFTGDGANYTLYYEVI